MCGKEFIIDNIKEPQETCGDRMCITNLEYRLKHTDPVTGLMPEPEEIRKWNK